MRRAPVIFGTLVFLLLGGLQVAEANKTYDTTLTGAAEVGGGDPDGSGTALIGFSPGSSEICFTIDVKNLATPTAAHIHHGAVGVNGPIVVALTAPSDGNGSSIGCVTVDGTLLKDIMQHPEDYYVNVHTTEYPGGAIRGQLGR
jgi:hypothetical protein